MGINFKNLCRLLGLLFVTAITTSAAEIHWSNPAGPGDWHDPLNWTPNQVPGPGDVAFIEGNAEVLLNQMTTVWSLRLGGPTRVARLIANQPLTLGSASTNRGVITVNSFLRGSVLFVEGDGAVSWAGAGGIDCPLVIGSGVTLTLTPENQLTRSLTNRGVVKWQGGGDWWADLIVNEPGGVFEVETDGTLTQWYRTGAIFNRGIWRKTGGTGTTYVGRPFYNTGTVDLQSGTVHFHNLTQNAGAMLLNGGKPSATYLWDQETSTRPLQLYGGVIRGSAVISPDYDIGSIQISPGFSAGRIQFQGQLGLASGSSLNVEIGGVAPETGFDQLVATTLHLDCAINVCLINGFIPTIGDRFEIVKANSGPAPPPPLNGNPIFTGLNVANGVRLVPEITATNIVLVATSVPPNPGPELNLFRDGDNLWLCWPRGYETFALQSAASLSPPNWQTITPTELNRLILTPGSPQRFFRMVGL